MTGETGSVSLSTAQIVIAILGLLGGSAVLAAVVTGLFNRKRLGADATKLITEAASSVVKETREDNARLRGRVDEVENELETERAERQADRDEFMRVVEEHTRALQLHAAWDAVARIKLSEAGIIDLPEPPPLYAPQGSPSTIRATLEG